MIVSLPLRGVGAAALAVGLLLAGCSSDSDVPPTEVSAPGGGTQANTDTGSGGTFPDVNTVPTQRPTSTIQDLTQAPAGLGGAPRKTQYADALVGGPTSTATPPPPPPPPAPELPPIPEPGIQTIESDASNAPAPTEAEPATNEPVAAEPEAAATEPVATPEVTESQPMEPVTTPEVAEPQPMEAPTAAADQPEGQTIVGTTGQPPATPESAEPEPAAVPEPAPAEVPQAAEEQPAPTPDDTQQAQLPASAAPNYQAQSPETYGITPPGSPANAPASFAPSATEPSGQPIGMIYFRDGSAVLSADDQEVLKQIADLQLSQGGMVDVIGHESTGVSTADFSMQQANQSVSEARANAVALQLVQYGVPQNVIRVSAIGETEATPTGDAANRRAEVYISAH